MKVADIHALLGIQYDHRSSAQAQVKLNNQIGKMKASVSKFAKSTIASFGGVGAAIAVGLSARSVLGFEKGLVRLDIASSGAMGKLEDVRDRMADVSNETGIAKDSILQAGHAFVALTGDGAAATQLLDTFARVSQATGSAMTDIAKTSAALRLQFKIAVPDIERAFSLVIAGGKAGAVELEDMSRILAGVAPLAASFAGGQGLKGLSSTSSALQIIMQGFDSASEAATGYRRMMGVLIAKADNFKGIEIFKTGADGVKRPRELLSIVRDISDSDIAKDPTLLAKAFGGEVPFRAFQQLQRNIPMWEEMSEATMHAKDVAVDYAKVMESRPIRIEKAVNRLKNGLDSVILVIADYWKAIAIATGMLILHSKTVRNFWANSKDMVLALWKITKGAYAYAASLFRATAFTVGFQSAQFAAGKTGLAAGLAIAKGWILALAPMVAVGALLGAIILLVDDIITSLLGGESVFSDTWIVDILSDAFLWIETKFHDLVDWVMGKINWAKKTAASIFSSDGPSDNARDAFAGMRKQFGLQTALNALVESGAGSTPGGIEVLKQFGSQNKNPEIAARINQATGRRTSATMTINVAPGAVVDTAAVHGINQGLQSLAREIE